jgi:hypothetical protein
VDSFFGLELCTGIVFNFLLLQLARGVGAGLTNNQSAPQLVFQPTSFIRASSLQDEVFTWVLTRRPEKRITTTTKMATTALTADIDAAIDIVLSCLKVKITLKPEQSVDKHNVG